jgi:anti-sigma regulatory factor (Ser/Thr protein kinase)
VRGAYDGRVATARRAVAPGAFRHQALFYAGDDDFVARTVPFLRDGVHRDEPVLVVVPGRKIPLLRDGLGRDADGVTFADMADVGANPARIIPAWRAFVAERPGPARGIGEPIFPERGQDELVECQRHEALLNVAFADALGFDLVCPYDTEAMPAAVVDEALRTHPLVHDGGSSPVYRDGLRDDPLPPPPADRVEYEYGAGPVGGVHRFVIARALAAGLAPSRALDRAVAVHELAIKPIRHASGRGEVAFWVEPGEVVCEVRDDGVIADPLVGRVRPREAQESGRGVWIVNQLCDLVQLRTSDAGTVVRVRMALD